MINCDCLSKNAKKLIGDSNLDSGIKSLFLELRTCGEIKDSEILDILNEPSIKKHMGSLKMVIPELMKHGLSKKEIDERLIELNKNEMIELERGCPIGIHGKELDDITIATPYTRYAYARQRR